MARDVRETKVHYSPSEKDGIFVVEVARGADSNTTPILSSIAIDTAMTNEQILSNAASLEAQAAIAGLPTHDFKASGYESSTDGHASCSKSNEQVLVHQPPNGMCADDDVLMIDEDGAVSIASPKFAVAAAVEPTAGISKANTGLSQSDLSVSSSGGSNQAYCYGTQHPYSIDTHGYPSNASHAVDVVEQNALAEPSISETTTNDTGHVSRPTDVEQRSNVNDDGQIGALPADNPIDVLVPPPGFDALPTTDKINPVDAIAVVTEKCQQNGIKAFDLTENGVCGRMNGGHTNGFNGNGHHHLADESNEFDSLMNLPAPPPPSACDDKLSDVTTLDALPPPPPELVPIAEAINVES